MKTWKKTDGLQWCCRINKTTYHLVEVRESYEGFIFVSGVIDIEDYSNDDIQSCIKGYGYANIGDMRSIYKEDAEGVIAECLFEQTSEMELIVFNGFRTEDEAESAVEKYITAQ
jgi:hypothetical protein